MTEPAAPEPPPAPEEALPPTPGFQMSGKRAVTEIAAVVAVVLGGTLAIVWFTSRSVDLLIESIPRAVDVTLGEQGTKLTDIADTACKNPEPLAYVESVAAPLVKALGDADGFHFTFRVLKSPEVNAFALPGGFVTVNSALLESAETGDEVAAVLAHELQHVMQRHGTRRMLREIGTSVVLTTVFGGTHVALPADVVEDFVSNAYSRDEELEADSLGLKLILKSGIDPTGMSRFFERLARTTTTPPAILSTHPDPGNRAARAAKAAVGATVTTTLPAPRGITCL